MKIIHFALAFATIGACCAQLAVQIRTVGPLAGGPFAETAVTGQPFTADAVIETNQTLADGTHIVNKQTTIVARDGQGRTRREEILTPPRGDGQQLKTVFISDPVAQVKYVLGPDHVARKLALSELASQPYAISVSTGDAAAPQGSRQLQHFSTSPSGASGALPGGPQGTQQVQQFSTASIAAENGGPSFPPSGESKEEQLGTQVISGMQADGSRTTVTIPAGQIGNQSQLVITNERWYSQELQATLMAKHNDPRSGALSYQLTNILRAEPPASLFQIPSDYTVEEPR